MSEQQLRFVVKAKDEASKVLRGVGGSLGALGKVAKIGMAIAAVGVMALLAAIGALVGFIFKAKAAYEGWMSTVVDMKRQTGLAASAASKLAGQFQLSGVDAKSGSTGVYMFGKALDKARQGGKAALTAFQRLHINLKDGQGHWRALDAVLGQARDKLSGIKDAATRAGIASALFGKGAKTMLPWLIRSKEEMAKYTGWLKEAGLIMGGKSVAAFKTYRENQKHLAVDWLGFKANAYAAFVPLINLLMPKIIDKLKAVAGWTKKFRKEAENKGILQAMRDLVPGFKKVEDGAKAVWKAVAAAWPHIVNAAKDVGHAIASVVQWLQRNKAVVAFVKEAVVVQFAIIVGVVKGVSTVLGGMWSVIKLIAKVVWKVTAGGFGVLAGAINLVADAASRALALLDKLAHVKGNMSPGGGGGGGGGSFGVRANGGIFTASRATAAIYGEAGRETAIFIPHNRPQRAADIMNRAGLAGGGGYSTSTINVNVVLPGGTTLIGEAERVGQILAPHVACALNTQARRLARGRALSRC